MQSFGVYDTEEEAERGYDLGLILFLGTGHGKKTNRLESWYVACDGRLVADLQENGLPRQLIESIKRYSKIARRGDEAGGAIHSKRLTQLRRMTSLFEPRFLPSELQSYVDGDAWV